VVASRIKISRVNVNFLEVTKHHKKNRLGAHKFGKCALKLIIDAYEHDYSNNT